jgi:hypothetical protein
MDGSPIHIQFMNLHGIAVISHERALNPIDLKNEGSVLVAIAFAAISLEAFINEITALAVSQRDLYEEVIHDSHLREMYNIPARVRALATALDEAEESQGQLLLKFQLARIVLTGEGYAKGVAPFQDVALLIKLRNALMHHRPEGTEWDAGVQEHRIPKIVSSLISRGLLEPPVQEEHIAWSNYVSRPAVSAWACNSAKFMIEDLCGLLPESDLRRTIDFFLYKREPTRESRMQRCEPPG